MQGKHGHLSREQKQLALRLHAKGWRLVDIAREIGCSAPMVGIMARTGHFDLLLRSPLAVAARQQREHQRPAAPVPPQGQRSQHRHP